jgi:hypothetical protein
LFKSIRNAEEYIVGSRKKIELVITVLNKGEDAFESMLYLFMPTDVNYVNINKSKNVRIFAKNSTKFLAKIFFRSLA